MTDNSVPLFHRTCIYNYYLCAVCTLTFKVQTEICNNSGEHVMFTDLGNI